MSTERVERDSGVVWRVRWRHAGHNRSKVLGRKRDAEAFDAEIAACSARSARAWRRRMLLGVPRLVKAGELQTRELPTGRAGYLLGDAGSAPTGARHAEARP